MAAVMEQRGIEWVESRTGKITASRICDVMALSKPKMQWSVVAPDDSVAKQYGGGDTGKKQAENAAKKIEGSTVKLLQTKPGEYLKARDDYLWQIVAEILTGEVHGSGVSAPTQWGIDVEPAARAAYEARYGVIVDETGFVIHPEIPYVGASPDGVIGTDGANEIKCPYNSIIHLQTITDGMPAEHMPQVQCGMWVTGRQWWDFISYDPRMPSNLRLYVQRIDRDEDYINRMDKHCQALWDDVQSMLAKLTDKAA